MTKQYDVAILGAGLAGLSLATRLAAPEFAHLRILVVDPRTTFPRDRTWSYWALRPHPFAAAVAKSYARWAVIGDGRTVLRHAPGLRYETIRADTFYRVALDRIAAAPHVELRLGTTASAIERDGAVDLHLGPSHPSPTPIRAALAFDSRPTPALGQHGLTQLFLGQEIETTHPVFDPGVATLMDFRGVQSGVTHFTYILPTTPHRALIEDTWFAPRTMSAPDHRRAIRDHLARHGIQDYNILFEERGALPMDPVFRPRSGRYLQPLGSPAGANRPSTGYAFHAIQLRCDGIAAALAQGRLPAPPRPRPRLIRAMDSILVRLLETRPEQAPRIFAALFDRCPPAALVRFLNDAATPADLLAVSTAIPWGPTLGMAARMAAQLATRTADGRMRWAPAG